MLKSFRFFGDSNGSRSSRVMTGSINPRTATRDNCLVLLAVAEDDAASFIRRVLRHPALNTHGKRMGKVVRATHAGAAFVATP